MCDVRVLLVSGSTWPESPHNRTLQGIHQATWPGVTTDLYDGILDLPAMVPGAGREPVAARDLLDRIYSADAVLFSTPEYAGGLPGTFKNLLDWTMGGCLEHKPVAWLDVARPGLGLAAHIQLRSVLTNLGAHIVEDACITVPPPAFIPNDAADGLTVNDRVATVMTTMVTTLRRTRDEYQSWI